MCPENVTFVASDSHKLVRYRRLDAKTDFTTTFILPKKPAGLLKNVLPKESGDVSIEFDSKNASFTLPNYKLVCRLVEGNYPNYSAVIPQDNPYKVIIDRRITSYNVCYTKLLRVTISAPSSSPSVISQ